MQINLIDPFFQIVFHLNQIFQKSEKVQFLTYTRDIDVNFSHYAVPELTVNTLDSSIFIFYINFKKTELPVTQSKTSLLFRR